VLAGAQHTGVAMSGHLRFCFATFVLLAGLSASPSPASSNPFADWFNVTPRPAAAPAPEEEECLPRPGKSTTAGQRWAYRLEGHRKCWFQTAETAVKKQVRRRAAKHRVAAPEESEASPSKRKAVVDARAELMRSTPAEAPQPVRPVPEFKVADAASVSVAATGAAAVVPSAPIENLKTDHRSPRQVDVETLLAAAPAPSDAVAASVRSAAPVNFLIAEAANDGRDWMATWLGVLLMALGLVSVLGSSRTLREAVLLRGRCEDLKGR
jgi:hypothetical protein